MSSLCYKVSDEFFNPTLIQRAADAWPLPDWGGWLRYDSPLERKRTCNGWHQVPAPCADLLRRMLLLDPARWLTYRGEEITADTGLYGAGMHYMVEGDHLDPHLDADRHPVLGLERRYNAILFLDHAQAPLRFWEAGRSEAVVGVAPYPGRLVVFETTDHSIHGVPCCRSPHRRSLAVYFWGLPAAGPGKRPRAQFVSLDGSADGKEELRRQRCQRGGLVLHG